MTGRGSVKVYGSESKLLVSRSASERRVLPSGALIRDALHKVETQLALVGIVFETSFTLGEVVFSGNALLSAKHTTPYSAVCGRVPNIFSMRVAPEVPVPMALGLQGLPESALPTRDSQMTALDDKTSDQM